jgi:choline dehydrogenase
MTETKVGRILFDGKRAVGVELLDGVRIGAGREIVLTAGAIATPKILQLSGIGDAGHLTDLGIPVVADLPGVGANYQDHLEVPVQGETRNPMSILGDDQGIRAGLHMLKYLLTHRGLLSSNVVESGGFVDTAGTGQPDIQFHVLPVMVGFADREPEPGHGLSIGPCFLRPRLRGTVKLKSADPHEGALFNANALSDPADIETLVRCVDVAIRILEAPALQGFSNAAFCQDPASRRIRPPCATISARRPRPCFIHRAPPKWDDPMTAWRWLARISKCMAWRDCASATSRSCRRSCPATPMRP